MSYRKLILAAFVSFVACAPAAPRERFADMGLPLVVTDASAPDCGATAPTVTTTPPPVPPSPSCAPGLGTDYPVGPGQRYATIGAVPWETLNPGDTVRVYPGTYREKIMIGVLGATAARPFKLCGVRGPNGELPVIDGNNATTRRELAGFFPYDGHQVRGLIIVGHPHSAASYEATPSHIIIEGLEIRGASPPNRFTDASGVARVYSNPAAGIFVERAHNITIRGCDIHENHNGVFAGTGGGVAGTSGLALIGNHIHDNGSLKDYYQHNSYIEAAGPVGTIYDGNRYGPVRGGKGAGLKDRGVIEAIRYNWIEGGAHLLDLVDAQEAKGTTVAQAAFHTTRVYGNVFIRAAPSGSMIHYGGDSGLLGDYRKGTLLFYNNTVIVQNGGYPDWTRTAIFELSTNEEKVWSRNNMFYSTVIPTALRPIGFLGARDQVTSGTASFAGDWASSGWTITDLPPGNTTRVVAVVTGLDTIKRGTDPGFASLAVGDYTIALSTLPLPAPLAPEAAPVRQYVKHQATMTRVGAGIGALVR